MRFRALIRLAGRGHGQGQGWNRNSLDVWPEHCCPVLQAPLGPVVAMVFRRIRRWILADVAVSVTARPMLRFPGREHAGLLRRLTSQECTPYRHRDRLQLFAGCPPRLGLSHRWPHRLQLVAQCAGRNRLSGAAKRRWNRERPRCISRNVERRGHAGHQYFRRAASWCSTRTDRPLRRHRAGGGPANRTPTRTTVHRLHFQRQRFRWCVQPGGSMRGRP